MLAPPLPPETTIQLVPTDVLVDLNLTPQFDLNTFTS